MPDVAFVFTVSRARSIPAPEAVLGCQQNYTKVTGCDSIGHALQA